MALSNWDTLSFNEKGESINGLFVSGDVKIEIYKNWLYVHDPKVWDENSMFINDTIMHVLSGNFIYKNINIHAKRGRQQSVLCFVYTRDYKTDTFNAMIGCGVYGFNGNNWVGVEEETYEELKEFVEEVVSNEFIRTPFTLPDKPLRFNQGDAFFAGILNVEIPATEIDNSDEPVIKTIVEGDKSDV